LAGKEAVDNKGSAGKRSEDTDLADIGYSDKERADIGSEDIDRAATGRAATDSAEIDSADIDWADNCSWPRSFRLQENLNLEQPVGLSPQVAREYITLSLLSARPTFFCSANPKFNP
jgi:hypothetical protein